MPGDLPEIHPRRFADMVRCIKMHPTTRGDVLAVGFVDTVHQDAPYVSVGAASAATLWNESRLKPLPQGGQAAPYSSVYLSCRARLSILPAPVVGSASANSIRRGTL